ncbi:formamidopyrimidine-DNA glycosylase [Thermomonospora echinospora]|uniref:Formamidopyrimidine-DNA glycosylase n=1 Tax=Thermomonospora echinospora TaxID=1992 RepID=A0A1H6CTH5_9ACTN|nr:DNA-formamidopyrimidine glycosylase family protein [Thermomonospora echinospora]SEG76369.1 formamidopyrimidine-DNA glycosylase [Thermomonospora echinospora]
MPELPEVEALASFLRERAVGRAVARVDVVAISALKTYDPPVTALQGLTVTGVARHGTFLDVDVDGVHLVAHLAHAGRLRWQDRVPARPARPGGRNPLAVRVHLDDGSGFDLTETGTRKGLAVHVVRDPAEVPGITALGPDPLDPSFTPQTLRGIVTGRRTQIKGLLRDQTTIAGIGDAYSDEILHTARTSPFKLAAALTDEEIETLHEAIVGTLREAVERSASTAEPGAEERTGLRVHGRTGQECPVCGDTIREVSFADGALQYCPTCQTGGNPLADRRMSRLLK